MNALNTVARLIGYVVLFSAFALAMLVLREYLETRYNSREKIDAEMEREP